MQEQLPPKVLRNEVIRRDPNAGKVERQSVQSRLRATAQLQRRGRVDLREFSEPLPVLEAFQDFLEAERIRTRKRILGLTCFFGLVLLTVIAGGILFAVYFQGRIQNDFSDIRTQLTNFRNETDQIAERALTSAEQSQAESLHLRETMQSALNRERNKVATLRSQVSLTTRMHQENIAQVQALLNDLEAQNRALRGEVETIAADLQEAIAAVPPASEPGQMLSFNEPITFGAPRHDALLVPIRAPDSADFVAWLLPIPE